MIQGSSRFRIASDSVGAKVIDGEAVIVNVASGRYHSLDGCGADAWELLTGGSSIDAAAGALADRYEVEPERAAADLGRLVDDLLRQGLLSADDDGAGSGSAEEAPPAGRTGDRGAYSPPELVTFTDIEDLLALDPPVPVSPDAVWKVEES